MTGSDSVFFDDGLLPGKTYTYTLASSKWNASAQATTMDTTSHNWTWEVDTLGIANSYLYDIAILNDTLAYAVGYIYLNDSTGKFDQQPYGVAVWNGARWQFKRVMAIGPTGAVSNLTPSGILAFSAADIWFANGGVFSWDGQSQNANPYWINAFQGNSSPILSEGQTAEKLFGSSDQSLYAVGLSGALAHYNGKSWQQIRTNLTTEIHDVWGGSNPAVGNNVVLSTMCNKYYYGDTRVLRLSSSGALDSIPWGMQFNPPYSVWFTSTSQVYVCGGGIFRFQNGAWISMVNGLPPIFANRVRGNGDNDLVVAGDFGVVAHFNGVSWQVYNQL